MKISDEIRNDFLCNDDVGEVAYRQLLCIADRIDRKMVELPKDAEGREIPLDTRVLYSEDGVLRNVRRFCYHVGFTCGNKWVVAFENGLEILTSQTHITPPDSLERIAGDIESAKEWCYQNGTGLASISESKLREWSDRIRKLAKEEGE